MSKLKNEKLKEYRKDLKMFCKEQCKSRNPFAIRHYAKKIYKLEQKIKKLLKNDDETNE